jgi:hypothetical protein
MNVFPTHAEIVRDYSTYIQSLQNISDPLIRRAFDQWLYEGKLIPEPLLQFTISCEICGSLDDLAKASTLHANIQDKCHGRI